MKKKIEVLIIGAGASGLMLSALLKSKNMMLLEHNSKVASKILISGGGKCNITNGNLKTSNFLGEQRFIRNVLKRFDNYALLEWLTQRGLEPIVRKNHQYFCEKSAKELVDILTKEIDANSIQTNVKVISVEKKSNLFYVTTDKGLIEAKSLIVASGGLSFPKIGATSIGYDIAKSFGHTISTLSAGLVGLTLQPGQFFLKSLSGIATEVKIVVGEKEIEGSLLFSHKGISGPAVLDASLYWNKGMIEIDFIPKINIETIKSSKKNISRILGLPTRVAKAFLDEFKIKDRASHLLTKEEWEEIARLKVYRFAPAGTFGYSKAEVTKGGISTEEIDASSMMSKKVENLYFLGEVIDVTGELGGYNFQWAFSSAYVCAKKLDTILK